MKEIIYLSVSGFNIWVIFNKSESILIKDTLIEQIKKMYSGFIIKKTHPEPDYSIEFNDKSHLKMLSRENDRFFYLRFFDRIKKGIIKTYYQISYIQFDLILQYIIHQLLTDNKGFMFHASAVENNNEALIFLGRSGSGKSTISTLLKKRILADEMSIIRYCCGSYNYYQAPFYQKKLIINKKCKPYKIGKIYLLNKSDLNKVVKLSNKEYVLKYLFDEVLKTYMKDEQIWKTVFNFTLKHDFYRLDFNTAIKIDDLY